MKITIDLSFPKFRSTTSLYGSLLNALPSLTKMESKKKFGVDGKKRFTLKFPDGQLLRSGTCDPNDDDRRDLEWNFGRAFLKKFDKHSYVIFLYHQELPEGTLVANGFYDHENDEFITIEQWLNTD